YIYIPVQEAEKGNSNENKFAMCLLNIKWWLNIAIYTLFMHLGLSTATLLRQLYYNRDGKSNWMATLAQSAGFPVLFPYYCISQSVDHTTTGIKPNHKFEVTVALAYAILGVFLAADCVMCSIGLLYLSASTFSIICGSQLAFNAFFSFFIHSPKCTSVLNSLFLFTIFSTLLIFKTDSAYPFKQNYTIVVPCIFIASAVYGFMFFLTHFSLRKLVKRETYEVVLNRTLYQSLIATCAALVGFLGSGQWKGIKREMEEFELGKLSYITTLIEMAITSQVFSIGAVGFILEVSSLFSGVIRVLELPFVPILAIMYSQNGIMDVITFLALILGMWGFVSYAYGYYLDVFRHHVRQVSKLPLLEG
ncbi:TPT domain-containing protein, partial [Cephalotus follicularis]